jgi:hypothetical protein
VAFGGLIALAIGALAWREHRRLPGAVPQL